MHNSIWLNRENAKALIMFVHGFMGSPSQFSDLLEDVYKRGCSACAVLLPGHGGTGQDFVRCGLADWEDHLQEELDKYTPAYPKIILAGHSMGGLLALNASLHKRNNISGVFLLSSPLKINFSPFSLLRRLVRLTYPVNNHIKATYRQAMSLSNIALSPRWAKPMYGFFRLMRKTKLNLPRVFVPVLAIHSRQDETVAFKSADKIYNGLRNNIKKRLTLEKSWHAYYTPEEWAMVRAVLLEYIGDCLEDKTQLQN